jgi:transposase
MRKVREVLRLRHRQGLNYRDIAASLDIGLGTVGETIRRAAEAGLDWEAVERLSEEELEQRLYRRPATPGPSPEGRPLPDFALVHSERMKVGVTLALLHEEYRAEHPDGYGYTQFCEHYQRWLQPRGLTMRQEHCAGDKVFVDYSGKKPRIVDAATGAEVEVELFVGVLGASNYTYAEASLTQRVPDWIASHVRMFESFGGVTRAIVPDQLKSGVTRASSYEPGLQRTYEDFAEHYGTAVVPARPARPRDKAKVEVAVQVAQRWILARLRKQRFFSLDELNQRIRELLGELNARRMRRYATSRRALFERVDQPALLPLPASPYVVATWSKVKVGKDYHVDVDGHGYSVPFQLAGKEVEVRATATTIEVLRRGDRATVHVRSAARGKNSTKAEHLPVAHRRHAEWTTDRIEHWAAEVGPATGALVAAILEDRPHPEQGYRSCLGILRLEKRYGRERLEAACARAGAAGARSYQNVSEILRRGLDRLVLATSDEPSTRTVTHENVRGPSAYEN